eukprot:523367-Pelagomonas_calceolata.AAC.4
MSHPTHPHPDLCHPPDQPGSRTEGLWLFPCNLLEAIPPINTPTYGEPSRASCTWGLSCSFSCSVLQSCALVDGLAGVNLKHHTELGSAKQTASELALRGSTTHT